MPRPVGAVAGAVGAGVLLATFGTARFIVSFFYYGMSTVAAVAGTLVIAEALRPSSWVSRCLCVRPLVAIGRISYGLYLWHYPVFNLVGVLNFYPNEVVVPPLGARCWPAGSSRSPRRAHRTGSSSGKPCG